MLYKRPTSSYWWCRFTINCQEIRRSTGTEKRADAEEFETKLRNYYWRQAKLGESVYTFGDAADKHLQELSIKTSGKDKQILEWLCDRKDERGQPAGLRDTALPEMTHDVFIAVRSKLQEAALSVSTVNHYLGTIRKVLRKAHFVWKDKNTQQPWLALLPKVPMLKRVLPDPVWATREQMRKLLAELPEHSADMTRFSVATGLRMSNVTKLLKSKIDRRRKVAWVEGSGAKAGKGIPVPLNADAMRVVNKWWNRHPTHLFCYDGHPIQYVTTRAWHKARERAGLPPNFTFHKSRHTWASWQVQAGTPLRAVQDMGGWADLQMVMRYSHLEPGDLRRYAGRTNLGTPRKQVKRKAA